MEFRLTCLTCTVSENKSPQTSTGIRCPMCGGNLNVVVDGAAKLMLKMRLTNHEKKMLDDIGIDESKLQQSTKRGESPSLAPRKCKLCKSVTHTPECKYGNILKSRELSFAEAMNLLIQLVKEAK